MTEAQPAAVLGGGYAGMAAAVELAAAGVPVTVFEAGPRLGGRARRVDHKDTVLDNGLHLMIGAYRETLRLIRLVHPAGESALLRMALDWNVLGELRLLAPRWPAPLHLLGAILLARGLSLVERCSAVRFIAALKRSGYVLDSDTSVEELLERHAQPERLRRLLWRPLCVAALNTPPGSASARLFMNVLRDTLGATRSASDLLIARVDLSALFPEPAAAWIARHGGQVLTGHRVTAITAAPGYYAVTVNGVQRHFSHVICALPPHRLAAIVAALPNLDSTAAMAAAFTYQPIYTVWLRYASDVELPSVMFALSDGPAHWVFDRKALCGQRGLIGAVISASGEHQRLTQDDLAARTHAQLKRRFPQLPEPQWHRVIAEKRATITCAPGVQRPPQRTPLPNFYLAGDYTESDYPATIEAAVRSGIACAHHAKAAMGR